MTTRLPVPPAPGTLEAFAKRFDPLFSQRSQRQAFCWWVAVGEGRTDDEDAAAPVTAGLVADGMTERAGMAGTVDGATALLAGVERARVTRLAGGKREPIDYYAR